jgi:hypothetical protein
MKKILVILTTITFLIICSSLSGAVTEKASKKKNVADITGAWKMEAYRHDISSNSFTSWPDNRPEMKFITGKNFCWISYDSKTGKILSSAGGTYTLEGDTYTENIEYGLGMDSYLGTKSKFKVRIEGDTMFITGSLSSGQRIEEIWHRVK